MLIFTENSHPTALRQHSLLQAQQRRVHTVHRRFFQLWTVYLLQKGHLHSALAIHRVAAGGFWSPYVQL